MKTSYFKITGLLLTITIIVSCKKATPPATNNTNTNTTQSTYNFTANVDSYLFQGNGSSHLSNPSSGGTMLTMEILDHQNTSTSYKKMTISIQQSGYGNGAITTGTYVLSVNGYGYGTGEYDTGPNNSFMTAYGTDLGPTYIGTLSLTKWDLTNKVTSGTFNFKGSMFLNLAGGTPPANINVTNGSFTDLPWQ